MEVGEDLPCFGGLRSWSVKELQFFGSLQSGSGDVDTWSQSNMVGAVLKLSSPCLQIQATLLLYAVVSLVQNTPLKWMVCADLDNKLMYESEQGVLAQRNI